MYRDGPLRVLIADDEKPARRDIRRMLGSIGGVEVVGEAADGPETVELIREIRPDLVLLDIQMPGLDGFQVLGKLEGAGPMPSVVFITAYDEHALRAFEISAVDYILKPVDEKRLARAIEGVRRMRNGIEERPGIEELLEKAGILSGRIALRNGESLVMVDTDDILYATVSQGEVTVVTRDCEGSANCRSLDELQRELPGERFMRVHRSYIANLRQVHEITPRFSGSYRLRMGGSEGPVIPVSRAQAKKLRRRLKW